MWPLEACVPPLLDAFAPEDRRRVLRRAFGHEAHVWILRQAERREAVKRDLRYVVALKAQPFARLPVGSLVAYDKECWAEARYDTRRVMCPAETWRLGGGDPQQARINSCSFCFLLDLGK